MDILTILSIGLLTFAFVNIVLAYKSMRESNRRLETFRRRIQREDDRMDSISRLLELRTALEREQRESYRPSRRRMFPSRPREVPSVEVRELFNDDSYEDFSDYIARRRKELTEEHQKEQKEKEEKLKIEKAKEKEKQNYNKNRTSRTAKAAKLLDEIEGSKKRQKKWILIK